VSICEKRRNFSNILFPDINLCRLDSHMINVLWMKTSIAREWRRSWNYFCIPHCSYTSHTNFFMNIMCSLHNLSIFVGIFMFFLLCFFLLLVLRLFGFFVQNFLLWNFWLIFMSKKFHPQTSIIYLTIYSSQTKIKLTREKVKIKMSLNQSRSDWLVANFLISNLTQFYGHVK